MTIVNIALFITLQAVIFRNKEDLLMVAQNIPFGAIIFLLDTEILYVRVGDGFKEILVSIELT